jgi:hypothetical protein
MATGSNGNDYVQGAMLCRGCHTAATSWGVARLHGKAEA